MPCTCHLASANKRLATLHIRKWDGHNMATADVAIKRQQLVWPYNGNRWCGHSMTIHGLFLPGTTIELFIAPLFARTWASLAFLFFFILLVFMACWLKFLAPHGTSWKFSSSIPSSSSGNPGGMSLPPGKITDE